MKVHKNDRELVVRLAEKYNLSITIRPDGSIYGPKAHLDTLRYLLDANEGE